MINMKFLVKLRHRVRIISVFIIASIAISVMILAVFLDNFYMSLLGSILIGITTTFGDLSIQGHLKEFSPSVFSGYSSGTGMAGVFGSCYFLLT